MSKQFIFNQNIAGSNNGYDVKEYSKDQIVDEKDLCEELITAWIKSKVITEIDAEAISNTGDEEVDAFLNGETDKLPEGTEEISEEEAKKLEEKSEENAENKTETETIVAGDAGVFDENGEAKEEENAEKDEDKDKDKDKDKEPDVKDLVEEAKTLLASEDTSIDTDRLKEIGIALHIQNMSKTVNGETIINKIKKFIEDYKEENAEKDENEAE